MRLQGRGYGSLLLCQIEATLSLAGVAAAAMPAWTTVRMPEICLLWCCAG